MPSHACRTRTSPSPTARSSRFSGGLVAAAVLLAPVAVAPFVAAPAAAAATATTATVSPSYQKVFAGRNARLTVRLADSAGRPVDGVVEVERRRPDGTWYRIWSGITLRTGSDGVVTRYFTVYRNQVLRARYRGNATRAGDVSGTSTIRVPIGSRALLVAKRQVGDDYRYGATGPDAFDCSGLTLYSFRQVGKSLPRSTWDQARVSYSVSKSAKQPGDLIFMYGRGHVGIYAGNGYIVDASRSGSNVKYRALWTSDYEVRRIPG